MPKITFVRDVPNETGDGLLYAAGYSADVSETTALKWVRSEDAVRGDHAAPAVPPKKGPLKVRNRALTKDQLNTAAAGGSDDA